MTETAVDDTITDDEQTPQEWADMEAARIGRIWAARWPGSHKDW